MISSIHGSMSRFYNPIQGLSANQNQSLSSTHQQKKMPETENNPPINEEKAALWEAMSKIPFKHITSLEEANANLKYMAEQAMKDIGITLGDNETLELSMGEDGRVKVSGLNDEMQARKLEDRLNANMSTRLFHHTIANSFYLNSDYAREGENFNDMLNRASLIGMKDTASKAAMDKTGVSMDFSQLYRTEDGKIAGYPKELSWIFEGNYDISNPSVANDRDAAALTVLNYANKLLDAPGGYESIPSISDLGTFSFVKSDFMHLNVMV